MMVNYPDVFEWYCQPVSTCYDGNEQDYYTINYVNRHRGKWVVAHIEDIPNLSDFTLIVKNIEARMANELDNGNS